jgi:predicted DNA-binding transcriptional regulator AlpA
MADVHGVAAMQLKRGLFENQIEDRYLTSAELAAFLGLSIHTVRAWRKFRVITPIKFGRSVRWLLKEVLEQLTKQRGCK